MAIKAIDLSCLEIMLLIYDKYDNLFPNEWSRRLNFVLDSNSTIFYAFGSQ